MTVTSGFFNSVNHDRLYDAEQLSSIFDGIILDGVYEGYGDAFLVSSNTESNDSIFIRTGRAWFDHTWILNDSIYSVTLDPPNEMVGRIDAVVLDIDRRTEVRQNSIKVITGTVGTVPTKPTLIKEELHNQYPIAYVTVGPGTSGPISNANIEHTIGSEECPLVVGILDAINTDNFWQQLDADFMEWWNGIKDMLDGNIETNVLNKVQELEDRIDSMSGESSVGEDGKIGNYKILLTDTMVDTMINGSTENTIEYKSSSIQRNSAVDAEISSSTHVGSSWGDRDDSYFFLPDGYRCYIYNIYNYNSVIGDLTRRYRYANTKLQFGASLINEDGVVTKFSSPVINPNDYFQGAGIVIGDFDATYYPVTIPVYTFVSEFGQNSALGSGSTYKEWNIPHWYGYYGGTITITEDHIVNFDVSKHVLSTGTQLTTSIVSSDYRGYTFAASVSLDNSRIALTILEYLGSADAEGAQLSHYDNHGCMAYKVNSDGVVTNGPEFVDESMWAVYANTGQASGYDKVPSDGKIYFAKHNHLNPSSGISAYGFIVDKSSLEITPTQNGISGLSEYVTIQNFEYGGINLGQKNKTINKYERSNKLRTTSEPYKYFIFYDRDRSLANAVSDYMEFDMGDGSTDIILYGVSSPNVNHYQINDHTRIMITEDSLTNINVTIPYESVSKGRVPKLLLNGVQYLCYTTNTTLNMIKIGG